MFKNVECIVKDKLSKEKKYLIYYGVSFILKYLLYPDPEMKSLSVKGPLDWYLGISPLVFTHGELICEVIGWKCKRGEVNREEIHNLLEEKVTNHIVAAYQTL